ncbi:cupin domain-containing protein [Priestia megaterium]|uniref:cupin domain-containing protein n=1 Tax=Priestia megaterium TaxID=1404 RepID=UPI00366F508A
MSNVKLSEQLETRVIRKEDFVADKTAFIDANTPGSDKKENYCIIGPGVSENENRVINLEEPHGFNVGAAAMPNGCVNSLHLHQTAEVFIVAKGTWRFIWGNEGKDGEAILTDGDVISLPTHIFRGFKNIGSDDGFLFSILGEDDPKKVTWGPQVLREAADYGLVLLEDGRLIDSTIGMSVPEGAKVIKPMSDEELAQIRKITQEEMNARVFRLKDRVPYSGAYLDEKLPNCKKKSYGIIGPGMADNPTREPLVSNEHSFSLELIEAEPQQGFASYKQEKTQVLLAYKGKWKVSLGEPGNEEDVILTERDLISVPVGMWRSITNIGEETGLLYIINGGDEKVNLEWSHKVINSSK